MSNREHQLQKNTGLSTKRFNKKKYEQPFLGLLTHYDHLFDFRDRLGWVKALWTGFCAIHYGVAAI